MVAAAPLAFATIYYRMATALIICSAHYCHAIKLRVGASGNRACFATKLSCGNSQWLLQRQPALQQERRLPFSQSNCHWLWLRQQQVLQQQLIRLQQLLI
jgi:hypothetical protein